jgi:hypothetical protein
METKAEVSSHQSLQETSTLLLLSQRGVLTGQQNINKRSKRASVASQHPPMLLTSAGWLFDAVRTWLSRVALIHLISEISFLQAFVDVRLPLYERPCSEGRDHYHAGAEARQWIEDENDRRDSSSLVATADRHRNLRSRS